MFRLLVFLMVLLKASSCFAWIGVTAYSSAGVGQLSSEEPITIGMAPLGVRTYLSLRIKNFLRLSLGGGFHHGRLTYVNSGIEFTGAYNAYSGNFGVSFVMGSFIMQFRADALVNASLSSKSEVQTEVNGVIYRHSTLVKYTSPMGGLARFGLIMENDDRQILNFMNMQVGLIFDVGVLPINKETTNIATNQIGPGAAGEWSKPVNYNFTYGAAGLLIGLAF